MHAFSQDFLFFSYSSLLAMATWAMAEVSSDLIQCVHDFKCLSCQNREAEEMQGASDLTVCVNVERLALKAWITGELHGE